MDDSQDSSSPPTRVEDLATTSVDTSSGQEPLEKKRRKIQTPAVAAATNDLQTRLLGVLSCSVCFDLPKKSIYQCQNGHLMCCGCFHHLLADGRLKNEQPSCPSCRIEIAPRLCIRNLAVEKAVSELPGECRFCCRFLPRSEIGYHETNNCDERMVMCPYCVIGCEWKGKSKDSVEHLTDCDHKIKHGGEVLDCVEQKMESTKQELTRLSNIVNMFSFEKVAICDLQLMACRTDDYAQKLYHESNKFSSLENNWIINTKVQGDIRSNSRKIMYQLCFQGKTVMDVKYFVAKGPFGEVDIKPDVQRYEFKDDSKQSDYHPIILQSAEDCNVLLSARSINIRLLMFQIKK